MNQNCGRQNVLLLGDYQSSENILDQLQSKD